MAKVKVIYNNSAINQKQYIVDWSTKDIERLMKSIKGTTTGYNGDYTTINCSTQDAYMIVTRFFIAPKVLY